jgi:predicted CoA-binding protein
MATMKEATKNFLSQKKIAVVGVSRTKSQAANLIYRKLRTGGYKVFAVNPKAATVEGDTCYSNLKSIPEKPDGVVIVTRPEVTFQVVRECAELGISSVWMHKGMDSRTASVSTDAVDFCHKNGIHVIPGGCPMMYCDHADVGHRFMRWLQALSGSLPKQF